MYKLAIGALFKNESHSIKEWIDHHLFHGVEHFYLINDSSTDNFLEIIQPYIDKNIITLFNTMCDHYLGRQGHIYNTYILPRIKETKWLLMIDIDEYVWSPSNVNLNVMLDRCYNLAQIQINGNLFGSNGYIEQPDKIVDSFTMRSKDKDGLKYFVNSDYEFSSLNVHHASFINIEDNQKFIIINDDFFILNHYSCQSKQFWIENKMTRGDADNYMIRTIDDFNKRDINEIEDIQLSEQNKQNTRTI